MQPPRAQRFAAKLDEHPHTPVLRVDEVQQALLRIDAGAT
jgi:hypothetical protein